MVRIGNMLALLAKKMLIFLLRQYEDVFAFEPSEMPGIGPDVMQHRLKVDPSHKPVIQKRRHLEAKWSAAVAAELKKQLEASFIRENPSKKGIILPLFRTFSLTPLFSLNSAKSPTFKF